MGQATTSTASGNILHCALELSKKSWLLAIQFPDREQPSLYPVAGGGAERLMAKLTQARDRWAKTSGALPMITLCHEVGYDAFWLARFLKARGIECLVIDPGTFRSTGAGVESRPIESRSRHSCVRRSPGAGASGMLVAGTYSKYRRGGFAVLAP